MWLPAAVLGAAAATAVATQRQQDDEHVVMGEGVVEVVANPVATASPHDMKRGERRKRIERTSSTRLVASKPQSRNRLIGALAVALLVAVAVAAFALGQLAAARQGTASTAAVDTSTNTVGSTGQPAAAAQCTDDAGWRFNELDCAGFVSDVGPGAATCAETWVSGTRGDGSSATAYEACQMTCGNAECAVLTPLAERILAVPAAPGPAPAPVPTTSHEPAAATPGPAPAPASQETAAAAPVPTPAPVPPPTSQEPAGGSVIQGVVIVEEELEKESEKSPWLTAFMVFVMVVVGCLCCWGVVCAAACKQVEDSCTAGSGCDECGCVTTNWGGATFASNHTLMPRMVQECAH